MMKIGCEQFNINPAFPVNRMLGNGKCQAVSDDLHCRVVAIWPDDDIPLYLVSIDTVELWKKREDQITEVIEEALGCRIHCIVSATHSHNCGCFTTDDDYVNFVLDIIRNGVGSIELVEYSDVRYIYKYDYFDKVGKSRVLGYTTPHVYAETLSIYGDGKRIVTFLIHNVHPTIKELWKGDFTAEYPGYCISKLREEYPGEFFTFMLGPAGDISPHYVRNGRDYAEMIRLAELLRQEFDRQLQSQKYEDAVPVQFRYEETILEKDTRPFNIDEVDMPDPLNEEEERIVNRIRTGESWPNHRELRDFETVSEYHLAHVILSPDYSMIFEPFELYSEYYGAVNKAKCSVITVSKGFEHYLRGLYIRRLDQYSTASSFSDKMRKRLWEILGRWSCQEDV